MLRSHQPGFRSPWLADVTDAAPALDGEATADVAVIGAGYTGLSAALALRAAGASVVILEQDVAGFGASGRNAGHLTPVIGKDLPTLSWFGRRRAAALVRLAETAVGEVERLIEGHGIDCAYVPAGNVLAAVHPRQDAVIDKVAAAAARLGVTGEVLEDAALRARGLPRAFTRGFWLRRGGVLHPGRYVRGLRRAALAAGARLFEGTPVTRIDDGPALVVHTARGRVRAASAVIATNAYTPELGWLRHTVLRVHVYLFMTEPLSAAQRAAIGWPGGEGVYTAHESLESYRLTADARIVGGAKHVRYGYHGSPVADDPATFAAIEAAFRDRFPELRGLPIAHRWGGPIGFALDFLPAVGRTGRGGRIAYSIGYAGHGIALGSYAGTMIADLLAGRAEAPGRALWSHWHPPLPPEPLRWLVVRGLTAVFGAVDRRVDRAARERPVAP